MGDNGLQRHSDVLSVKYNCTVLFLDKCIGCLFRSMNENRISHVASV